jgi:hypothetical protein
MITDGAKLAAAVIMDARNECGHDKLIEYVGKESR